MDGQSRSLTRRLIRPCSVVSKYCIRLDRVPYPSGTLGSFSVFLAPSARVHQDIVPEILSVKAYVRTYVQSISGAPEKSQVYSHLPSCSNPTLTTFSRLMCAEEGGEHTRGEGRGGGGLKMMNASNKRSLRNETLRHDV